MFLAIILSFLYNVFKNLPFLDRQNSGLFGTQTYTRGINFLHSKIAFNHHHALLPLQCFQKPSLFGSSKIGMFGTQTYTRGIDFLLSKNIFKFHSLLLLQCFQKPFLSESSKLGIVWYSNLDERYRFSPQLKIAFNHYHSLFPLQYFQKTFNFWIVKTRDCLVLKLTREVSISSSAKNSYNLDMQVWSVWSKTCFQ